MCKRGRKDTAALKMKPRKRRETKLEKRKGETKNTQVLERKGGKGGKGREAQPVNKYKRLLLHLLPVFVVERKEKKVPDERGWK